MHITEAACLIHYVIGCMLWHIKRIQQAQGIGTIIKFAKHASCCELIFADEKHTVKSMKMYTP